MRMFEESLTNLELEKMKSKSKLRPKIIDLFSGCGGLALGFEKAGFEISAGLDLMQVAIDTISYNLFWRYGKEENHLCGDITKMEPSMFQNCFGPEGCIVIGGPPCQAYSSAGRGKLRSLGEHRVNIKDTRGYLYQDFLRFAYGLDAKVVIMENVAESTHFGNSNIPEIVCEDLSKHGYNAYWTILCSADYGVPQIRERVFVLAIKAEFGWIPLPSPSNRSQSGYITAHTKQFPTFDRCLHFKRPIEARADLPPWITVGDAFSDLPSLFPDWTASYPAFPINLELAYKSEPRNDFQKVMRTWYGTCLETVTGNVFRNNKRDFPIFAEMKQGDNYVDASRIADSLFEKKAARLGICSGTKEYDDLKKSMVPIYDRDSFLDKWRRLEEDRPSHTVVAHLSMDTYSHIHPWEHRGISVREAARLQSFPDGFFFGGPMSDSYKLIGNAVPPLLAYAVAESVNQSFNL